MPDLEDLLAAEAARYDIRQPPVAVIRRRRQRRVLARAGGTLAAVALLGAAVVTLPGLDRGRDVVADGRTGLAQDRHPIEGLRTDPDGRGLVAAYVGGACDGADSLLVEETDDRVDVAVRVLRRPGDDENTVCPAVGIGRTVRADLAEPLGDRAVYASGKLVDPYDGADLVVPGRLPDGFVLRSETGAPDAGGWTQEYGAPREDGLGGPCRPGERSLSVSTGLRVRDAFSAPYFLDEGSVDAGDGEARLYSQGSTGSVRYLALEVDGQPVSVSYSADCGGPAPSVEELVDIAEGLRPARP